MPACGSNSLTSGVDARSRNPSSIDLIPKTHRGVVAGGQIADRRETSHQRSLCPDGAANHPCGFVQTELVAVSGGTELHRDVCVCINQPGQTCLSSGEFDYGCRRTCHKTWHDFLDALSFDDKTCLSQQLSFDRIDEAGTVQDTRSRYRRSVYRERHSCRTSEEGCP